MTVFENRREAGKLLAATLRDHAVLQGAKRLVVLAIPRGGLPVAAEVARELGAEFDVAVIRKLRSPHNLELDFGSVGADGHVDLDEAAVAELGLTQEQVDAEIADRQEAVRRRVELYRGVAQPADLAGATVLVVDDGIATGGTARPACLLARRQQAAKVVLAVPVAPRGIGEEFADVADAVVVLTEPAEFMAVDQAYREFAEIDDGDALAALSGTG
jgi:putative phosphoribosyl transferase